MKVFELIVLRVIVGLLGTSIATGILLLLHAKGYFPEQWVSRVLGGIIASPGVELILCGLFGFGCLGAWEIFHVSGRLKRLGTRRDVEARVIEIIFDEEDQRSVIDEPDWYGGIRVRRWRVGVRNASLQKNIDEISLRAHQNQFVDCTIAIAHSLPGRRLKRNPVILELASLSPDAAEFVELFGLSPNDLFSEGDILSKKQTFTLEARGRDAKTVLAVLEYPSSRPPVIRRES
jgi:hypothetical protein